MGESEEVGDERRWVRVGSKDAVGGDAVERRREEERSFVSRVWIAGRW